VAPEVWLFGGAVGVGLARSLVWRAVRRRRPRSRSRSRYGRGHYSAEYLAYMKSAEWRSRRARVLSRDLGRCRLCGARASQVHHVTYTHLAHERPAELVSLCTLCHHSIHAEVASSHASIAAVSAARLRRAGVRL
jgi:5-methylcytosine-specific restriction endonuclease McrA